MNGYWTNGTEKSRHPWRTCPHLGFLGLSLCAAISHHRKQNAKLRKADAAQRTKTDSKSFANRLKENMLQLRCARLLLFHGESSEHPVRICSQSQQKEPGRSLFKRQHECGWQVKTGSILCFLVNWAWYSGVCTMFPFSISEPEGVQTQIKAARF